MSKRRPSVNARRREKEFQRKDNAKWGGWFPKKTKEKVFRTMRK